MGLFWLDVSDDSPGRVDAPSQRHKWMLPEGTSKGTRTQLEQVSLTQATLKVTWEGLDCLGMEDIFIYSCGWAFSQYILSFNMATWLLKSLSAVHRFFNFGMDIVKGMLSGYWCLIKKPNANEYYSSIVLLKTVVKLLSNKYIME